MTSDARPELLTAGANDALFITNYGEAYSADCLGRIVKSHMKKAGIEAEGAAQRLRHAMATHMLENGADIRFIQTNLRAPQVYTQVTVEKKVKGLSDVVLLGRGRLHAMNDTQFVINAYMRLYAKMPFITFLCLMHLGIMFAFFIFARGRCRDAARIDYVPFFKH